VQLTSNVEVSDGARKEIPQSNQIGNNQRSKYFPSSAAGGGSHSHAGQHSSASVASNQQQQQQQVISKIKLSSNVQQHAVSRDSNAK